MQIKLLILDVDGVLTDGKKTYNHKGNAVYKSFNDRDFTAIKSFKASGVRVIFLSGDRNINEEMARNRRIEFFHSRNSNGVLDKSSFLPRFEEEMKISPINMAYIGDDIFDIDIMTKVNFPFCPSDAVPDVKEIAYTLDVKGGEGVVVAAYHHCIDSNLIKKATKKDIIALDATESAV